MAQVTGLLGNLTGTLGNIVIVHRGNKTFIRCRPAKRAKKPTPELLKSQDMFKLASKIACGIASVEELKFFWPPTSWNHRSSINRLFKVNYGLFDLEAFTGMIQLTDCFGFDLTEPSINIGENSITLEAAIDPQNFLVNNKEIKNIIAAGVIILKNPAEEDVPGYEVMSFKTDKQLFTTEKKITFPCPFKGADLRKFESYSIKKAFAVLITLNKAGNPLGYSTTFSNKII